MTGDGTAAPTGRERITSVTNPRVKRLVRLRDRRHRDDEGVFVVEGYRAVRRMLDTGVAPRELYVAPEWFQGVNEAALVEDAASAGAEIVELGRDAFAKCAYRDRPDGLLAVVAQWHLTLGELDVGAVPFVLVVEAIEKPGNLGTILRSADAAGVGAVLVCDQVTDIFNPNVVRSSTGVLFRVPIVVASSADVQQWLRAHSIRTVATTPDAALTYSDADLTGPLAVVMGSEQFGLSDLWLGAADVCVRIPMAGQADSLNVGMATVVTLFEAVRQRAGGATTPPAASQNSGPAT